MKKLAYMHKRHDSDIITVYKSLLLKENYPDNWEGRDFYDIIALRPMRPCKRINQDGKDSSSFSFLKQCGGSNHGRGSKGIAHELVQEYLCKKETLVFKLFKKEFEIKIDRIEDEVLIVDPENDKRRGYVDCMLYLATDSPNVDLFGPKVAFEITDTHQNTNRKKKIYKDLGLTVFEITVISDWHIKNETMVEKEDIWKLRGRIKGFLNSKFFPYLIYCENKIT